MNEIKPPEKWVMPAKPKSTGKPVPLAHGLHLMPGAKASGKTITSVSLGLWMQASEVPVHYEYVMEPRSPQSTDLLKTGEWQKHLVKLLKTVKNGVLFIDSLTYLVPRLDIITEMDKLNQLSNVTYSGGLSPRDILGILLHDSLARTHEVALVATLNSELFPVIDKLQGACEGEFQLSSPGSFRHRDRTTRIFTSFQVPEVYFRSAVTALYPESAGETGVLQIDRY